MGQKQSISNIFTEVLQDVRPDKGILSNVSSMLENINKAIMDNSLKAKAVTGGSIAKGTFLKNDYDVDIFVRFDYSYLGQDLSEMLGKILQKLKSERVHGSRDYFQIKGRINYEIVPVLGIEDIKKAENVTDASPFHVSWVAEHANDELKDDIRLAKQFCKAQKVYGAESYIKGFSGHVLDILVIYYGSFSGLLKNASKWKAKTIIDFDNVYKGKAMRELNKSKTHSPLVVIDPVQADRNAAAALGKDKFDIFIKAAKDFLKSPDKNFFKIREFSEKDILERAKGKKINLLYVTPLSGKKDVVGAKILKVFEYIEKKIKENDFNLVDSGWQWNETATLWFITEDEPVSDERLQIGPPVAKTCDSGSFRKKHRNTFIKNNRLYANVKRKYIKSEKLIAALINEAYVKEKTGKITLKAE